MAFSGLEHVTPWIALGFVLGSTTLVWLLSLARRDASIADVYWGLGFASVAWVYAGLVGAATARAGLVPVLVTVWGLRLALHILLRGRGRGEDYRYAEMRARHGRRFSWLSLVTVFWLQGVILWVVALPLWVAIRAPQPREWTAFDTAGLLVFSAGFLFEAVADLQLARFKADPASRGLVMERGLWRYSRHPNYFGDALLWWGLFLFAAATPGSSWSAIGPALMTFLLVRVSGVALLERKQLEVKPHYRDYVDRTSAFIPWPPRRGRFPNPGSGDSIRPGGSA